MLPSLYGSENGGADKRFISTDDTSMSQFSMLYQLLYVLSVLKSKKTILLLALTMNNSFQCKREGWKDKFQEQKNEGCRVFGYVEVSKVCARVIFCLRVLMPFL